VAPVRVTIDEPAYGASSALGAINPFVAAALHNLSTLLVVFNSARLIGYDPDPRR
jgi:cation transport ATPase